jgi:hypothetical protein
MLRQMSANAVIAGAYAYGISWISATIFYWKFGVRPEQVGLGWTELVAQSFVVLGVPTAIAGLLMLHSRMRSKALAKLDISWRQYRWDPARYLGALLERQLFSRTGSISFIALGLTLSIFFVNAWRIEVAHERIDKGEPLKSAFGLHTSLPRVSLKVIGDGDSTGRAVDDEATCRVVVDDATCRVVDDEATCRVVVDDATCRVVDEDGTCRVVVDDATCRVVDEDDKKSETICLTLLGSADGQTLLWHKGDLIRLPTDLTMIYEPCFD